MGIGERIIGKAVDSKTIRFLDTIRVGWNNYSFIFYIGGISAILGGLFGIAGWLSAIVTVLFFYIIGKAHKKMEIEKEKRKRKARKFTAKP